jgi:hypothetical protein
MTEMVDLVSPSNARVVHTHYPIIDIDCRHGNPVVPTKMDDLKCLLALW